MGDFEDRLQMIKNVLDYRVASHSVHATNIANQETPNFKARVPEFEATLKEVADQKPQWNFQMRINESQSPSRSDGNNVSTYKEMEAMTKNGISYETTLKILNKELAIRRYAIDSTR